MQHEPQQPATRSASPTPGTSEPSPRTAGPTRRELRLAAQRAAEAAARDEQAPPDVTSAGRPAPVAAPVTRRMLREAEAARSARTGAPVESERVAPAVATLLMAEPAPTAPRPAAPSVAVPSAALSPAAVSPAAPAPVATPVAPGPALTRRELRLKQQAACPPAFPLIEQPATPAPASSRRPHRAAKSATVLALSGALLVSGFALQDGTSAQAGTSAAAQAAEQRRLHGLRVAGAETARLTAQAEAYAVARRTEALAVAAAAIAQADAVVQSATPLVQPEAVAPLDSKAAELEALVGASEQPEATTVAPSAEDAMRDVAVERASRSAGTRTAIPDEVSPPSVPVAPATDLEATQEMLTIAQQVAELTAQVQSATETRMAEEAARAAAEAAAAEVARKVALAEGAPNGQIPAEALCAPAFAPDAQLRCDAAAALEQLNEVYRAEFGKDLSVVSSYRSYSMQVATRRSRGGLAATPGTSNHGRAVAVDFGDFGRLGSFGDADYLWMKEHGPQFGWNHPRIMEPGGGGPQEPWHWEYGTGTGWDGPSESRSADLR